MSTSDYNIANITGAAFRTEFNSMMLAMLSLNSNATEPTDKFAGMWWHDTTAGLLKRRNTANTSWITFADPEAANFGLARLSIANTFAENTTFSKEILPELGIRGKEDSLTAHATTMNPWNKADSCLMTGTAVTVTDLANAPRAGITRLVRLNAAHTFNNTATVEVHGGANWTGAADDFVMLYAKSTTVTIAIPMKKDGTAVVGAAVSQPTKQEFTVSGTWNRPAGCTRIKVYSLGAGGGSPFTSTAWSGPGGGGGMAISIVDVTAISSVTVTIGAGVAGGAGNDTTFGTHATGKGGGAGATSDGNAGRGGDPTDGNFMNIAGEDGKRESGRNGGNGALGGRGAGQQAHGAANTGAGSGGSFNSTQTGGSGLIIVEEFYD